MSISAKGHKTTMVKGSAGFSISRALTVQDRANFEGILNFGETSNGKIRASSKQEEGMHLPRAYPPVIRIANNETNQPESSSVNRPKQALISDLAGITFARLVFTKQLHDVAKPKQAGFKP
jgi:hypothetical protein